MKYLRLLESLFAAAMLIGCGNGSSSAASSEAGSYNLTSLKNKYGAFSIQVATSGVGSYTYDEANNVYTLAVASTKAEYIFSGFFDGAIVVENSSGMASYKGVKITLTDACLAHSGNRPTIDYTLEDKNVEIKSQGGTYNYVLNLGSNVAIYSGNNIEFSGKGDLELASTGKDCHTVRASADVYVYSAPSITVPISAHDAFHGNHLYFYEKDDVSNLYTGTMKISNVVSQAFDFETSGGNGSINVNSGKIYVDNADSVFKTDSLLTIGSPASVIATNIISEPYVQGDNSSGLKTSFLGIFTVDGKEVS